MFNGNEPWNQTKYLCGPALGLEQDFFVWNELLRGCGDGTVAHHRHFWNVQDVRLWVVGKGYSSNEQGHPCDHKAGPT